MAGALLPLPPMPFLADRVEGLFATVLALNAVALVLICAATWLKRAARPLCITRTFVTLAIRKESVARRIPPFSGTVLEKSWWPS
ncbi:MAG: hypothetical protein QM765_52765 [Myxococcales bacterium]